MKRGEKERYKKQTPGKKQQQQQQQRVTEESRPRSVNNGKDLKETHFSKTTDRLSLAKNKYINKIKKENRVDSLTRVNFKS